MPLEHPEINYEQKEGKQTKIVNFFPIKNNFFLNPAAPKMKQLSRRNRKQLSPPPPPTISCQFTATSISWCA